MFAATNSKEKCKMKASQEEFFNFFYFIFKKKNSFELLKFQVFLFNCIQHSIKTELLSIEEIVQNFKRIFLFYRGFASITENAQANLITLEDFEVLKHCLTSFCFCLRVQAFNDSRDIKSLTFSLLCFPVVILYSHGIETRWEYESNKNKKK
jgi:hypothetical protein